MVQHRACVVRGLFAAAVILLFVLAAFPMPGSASHWQFRIESPKEGMSVEIDQPSWLPISLSFREGTPLLAGHHEWRETAEVDLFVTHENETRHYQTWAQDLETGFGLGSIWSWEYERPVLGATDALTWEHRHHSFDSDEIVPTWLLPEALLWGRSFWPGESWDIGITYPGCEEGGTRLTSDGDWQRHGFGNVTVQVTTHCRTASSVHESAWDLAFADDSNGPFAVERSYSYNSTYWYGDEERNHAGQWYANASVIEEGDQPLRFQGRSEVAFVAERDQMLRYSTWDNLFPEDPEPHDVFDMREAGAYALDPLDEDVRVFLSRAQEVHLWEASVSVVGTEVEWRFRFGDDKGNVLRVTLDGVKAPGTPLIIWRSHTSHDTTDPARPPAAAGEVAYPGDLARLSDQALQAAGKEPSGYGWERSSWSPPVEYRAAYRSAPEPLGSTERGAVTSDAETGIVTGHRTSSGDYGVHPDRLV